MTPFNRLPSFLLKNCLLCFRDETTVKILIFPFLILLCLLAGCQTTPLSFQTPGAHWQTETGQLQYSNAKRSIIGECVVTCFDDSDFQLDFLAGPGFPVMKLRQSGNSARAEVAFAHLAWQGNTAHSPGRLKPWLALREVFSRLSTQPVSINHLTLQSEQSGFWHANANLNQGRPLDVSIDFPATKERFVFHFNS
jgi:hypothetical protein